ncbi:hypothetical protein AVEN_178575-1 [Araneus ventricosus]|uniref:Uncharacterized protein n=1 Tax=Araneus ventricosus TaxID=182803 RepID=A0A4Y2FJJ3_ARAVE|nr:hypothetical protein AVEN_178575-1 [Araneus ventricosus]
MFPRYYIQNVSTLVSLQYFPSVADLRHGSKYNKVRVFYLNGNFENLHHAQQVIPSGVHFLSEVNRVHEVHREFGRVTSRAMWILHADHPSCPILVCHSNEL